MNMYAHTEDRPTAKKSLLVKKVTRLALLLSGNSYHLDTPEIVIRNKRYFLECSSRNLMQLVYSQKENLFSLYKNIRHFF